MLCVRLCIYVYKHKSTNIGTFTNTRATTKITTTTIMLRYNTQTLNEWRESHLCCSTPLFPFSVLRDTTAIYSLHSQGTGVDYLCIFEETPNIKSRDKPPILYTIHCMLLYIYHTGLFIFLEESEKVLEIRTYCIVHCIWRDFI